MNQRGFIQLAPMMWVSIAAGAVVVGLMGAVYVQTVRLNAEKADFATFKGGVEALGEAAKRKALDQEMADKLNKEKSDAEHAKAVAALTADIARLRARRPAGGGLSAPAPIASSPDRTCFDPALFAGALRSLDEGIFGIAAEGSQAVIDLDAAKAWAAAK